MAKFKIRYTVRVSFLTNARCYITCTQQKIHCHNRQNDLRKIGIVHYFMITVCRKSISQILFVFTKRYASYISANHFICGSVTV